jgi:hypothetical protein
MALDLAWITTFERTIRYQEPALTPSAGIAMLLGACPVLISAPHSARHKRSGFWKQEDEYTAAITVWLHRTLGTHAIYLTHEIDPDPHDDDSNNVYKQQVAAFIAQHPVKLVLDLHGTRGDRDFGIALGTMQGISCPAYETPIIQAFEQAGFVEDGYSCSLDRLVLNHPFYTGGLKHPTITRFVSQELNIPAMQIEINAWIRVIERLPHASNAHAALNFRADVGRFERVIEALKNVVEIGAK